MPTNRNVPGGRTRMLMLAAVLTLLGAASIAYASIPDGNGVIHACYTTKSGTLRVIDDTIGACNRSESPLEWNQAGPPGPQGLQGEQGPQGPQGDQGPPGVSGYTLLFMQSASDSAPVKDQYAWCPPGKKILGGGVALNQPVSGIAIYRTQPVWNAVGPSGIQDGWWGSAEEIVTTSENWALNVYAICANVGS